MKTKNTAAALRKALVAAPIFKSSNDGSFGCTVVVRCTSTAEKIEKLAADCGATVFPREVYKRQWCSYSKTRSQAIKLTIMGADSAQDAYLSAARKAA